MSNLEPVVTIACITFNQENYIREAIDGFLSQQTNFKFEIIVHDDASTDNTANIIREYQTKYPDIIKTMLQEKNQYSFRGFSFLIDLFNEARGKYIALCEGDDYWIDSLKLQKQVDFLESNHDFSICFHKIKILENGQLKDDDITQVLSKESTILDLARLGNYIHTPSCVFRNHGIKIFGSHFQESPVGDYYLHMINAQYGKIYHIEEVMAVYRLHSTSSWSSQDQFYREEKFQLARMAILKDLLPTSSEAIQNLAEAYLKKSLYLISQFDYGGCMAEIADHSSYFPRSLLIRSLIESQIQISENQNQLAEILKELNMLHQRSVLQHLKERIKTKLKIFISKTKD